MLQVSSIKQKIEELQQFPVSQQKLIHAGKVLKDDSTLGEYNVKENDFLVVMVTKPKAAKPSAAAAAPSASAATASSAATSGAAPTPNTSSASNSSSVTASAVSIPSAAPATTAPSSSMGEGGDLASGEQMSATVQQLVDMGFPADQVRTALRAAFNNPERAVEYLMTGIPEQAASAVQAAGPSAGANAGANAIGDETANTLEALRNHPQFDALRQLVQSNPAALPAVLQQIGAQSPELLQLIHQNQDRFVQMLNEPIGTRETGSAPGGAGVAPFDMGMGGGAMPSPQQIQQLVDSLTPEQQAQMATQMGMTPEQLRGLSQMLSNLPPGAMEQMMASMGGGSGLENLGGGAGPGAGGGGRRIMLSEEEAVAVDRLCEMGFERTDVIQAYLACDKNEALAANFLMDSGDSFGGDAAGGAGDQGDDNDDIYG